MTTLGFSDEQRRIYAEVTRTARTLDEQLISLYELERDQNIDRDDAAAVRRWLSDQIDRSRLRW